MSPCDGGCDWDTDSPICRPITGFFFARAAVVRFGFAAAGLADFATAFFGAALALGAAAVRLDVAVVFFVAGFLLTEVVFFLTAAFFSVAMIDIFLSIVHFGRWLVGYRRHLSPATGPGVVVRNDGVEASGPGRNLIYGCGSV